MARRKYVHKILKNNWLKSIRLKLLYISVNAQLKTQILIGLFYKVLFITSMCIGSTWRFSVCLGSFLLSICKLFVSNSDSVCSYWHSKRSYFNFVFGRRVSWLINLDSCFNCCDVEEFEWIMIECLREVLQWDQRGSHFPSHATITMLPGTTTSNLRGGSLKK